jgi:hypothetical protein
MENGTKNQRQYSNKTKTLPTFRIRRVSFLWLTYQGSNLDQQNQNL